jgi:hypothetical protein
MPMSPPTPAPTPAAPAPERSPPARQTPSAPASAGDLNLRLILEGMAVAGIAAVLGRLLAGGIDLSESHDSYKAAEVVLRRGVTWALVGVALAVWLAIRMKRTDITRVGLTGLFVGAFAGAIGGAIWAARVYLPEPNLATQSPEANAIQILSLAVTCGLIGALIGGLWRQPRGGIGLAGGLVTGALLQLIINALGWNTSAQPGNAFNFGLAAIAVTGVVLAALLALDRQEPAAAGAAVGTGP